MRLSKTIFGKHHERICHKYFTSIPLFKALEGNGTYATSTCRVNRMFFPQAIKGQQMDQDQDQFFFRQDGNFVSSV